MGYPTPEQREQWKDITPGPPPPGPAGASSANRSRQQAERMREPLILAWEFKECDKPDCFRRVRPHVAYCCAECATAAAGRYEIHEHSEGCEQRHAERGEYGKEWRPVSGEETST